LRLALIAVSLAAGLSYRATAEARADDEPYDRSHWSLQPGAAPVPPDFSETVDRDWVRNEIDAFVLAQLKPQGLRPAPEADRRSLVRRLYFDLIQSADPVAHPARAEPLCAGQEQVTECVTEFSLK